MGLLDSVIGALGRPGGQAGGGNADLLGAVIGMLGQGMGNAGGRPGGLAGGLAGLVEQFTRGGLGNVVQSWIGTGHNLPVSADQLSQVLGSDTLGQIARQLGLSHDEAATQVSQLLPQVVDQLTPDGQLPAPGSDLGSLADIGGALDQLQRR